MRKRLMAVIGAGVLALSGCSGSGSDSDELVVGYQAPLSGSLSFLGTGNLAGFEAYFDMRNDDGGIDGRTVRIETADDQGKVDVAVTKFRELAREGALVVGGFPISTVNEGVVASAETSKVPMIGYGINTDALVDPPSPWAFSTASTARAYVADMATYVQGVAEEKGISSPKVAVLAVDTAASKQVRDLVEEAEGSAGWSLVASEFIPLTASDANAQVANIAGESPDFVFVWAASPLLPMIANGAKANGLDDESVQLIGADFVDNEAIMATTGLTNYYYDQNNLWSGSDDPALAEMQEAAAKYGSESDLEESYFTDGWIMGQLVAAALEECPDDCTGEDVSDALQQVDLGDAGGLAGPDVGYSETNRLAFSHHRVVRFDPATGASVPVSDWTTADTSSE